MSSVEYLTGESNKYFDGALGGLFLRDRSLLMLDAATVRLALWYMRVSSRDILVRRRLEDCREAAVNLHGTAGY
jgi:hypothetical protein